MGFTLTPLVASCGEHDKSGALTDVLLLELAGEVPLDECGLSDSAITDHHELELCLRLHGLDLLDVLLGELVLWDSLGLEKFRPLGTEDGLTF